MGKRIREGDVFKFRIDEQKYGIGQIIRKHKSAIYIVIFEPCYDNLNSIDLNIAELNPVLIGMTNDAMLKVKGFWEILGNIVVNEEKIIFPNYKVNTVDGLMKTDFEGNIIGKVTKKEESLLLYQKYVTPGVFESAFKAFYKIIPWEERFNSLLYSNVKRSVSYR